MLVTCLGQNQNRLLEGRAPVHSHRSRSLPSRTRSVRGAMRERSRPTIRDCARRAPGSRILLDDGAIELYVERTTETDVTCRVINGGVLNERKGINLPGIKLPIPSLTDKDRRDLQMGCAPERGLHSPLVRAAGRRLPLKQKL